MVLSLNLALKAYGLDPAEVRLLRHQNRGADGRTPYALWRDDRGLFEAYQGAQAVRNRHRLNSAFWTSFVVTPEGATMLAGVYAVRAREPMPANWPYPLSARPVEGRDELYRLDRQVQFAEWEGRLVIDWGPATRTWVQRADRQNKPITELAKAFAEPPFPGFGNFVEPLSRVMHLPATWATPLRAARGIYLLTCPKTHELYVGSATGADGFLGRWRVYAVSGHGGNVRLRSRETSDYQVSVLEVASSLATDGEILALEALWKRKLQSREMGLNAN